MPSSRSIAGKLTSPGGLRVDLGDFQGVQSAQAAGYDLPPPATKTWSASAPRRSKAASRSAGRSPRARNAGSRVTTMVVRPGSGRPIETYVIRPMISRWPMVSGLNRASPPGSATGCRSRADHPVAGDRGDADHLRVLAARLVARSDRDRGLDARVRVVALDRDVAPG